MQAKNISLAVHASAVIIKLHNAWSCVPVLLMHLHTAVLEKHIGKFTCAKF
jgi:hypothetical protein